MKMSKEGKKAMGKKPNHEKHKMGERERRKRMKCLYSILFSLLPHSPLKANKTMIMDEAMNYMLTLKTTFKNLQNDDQLPVAINTWTSSNLVLNIIGNVIQFLVYAPNKPELFTAISGVLHKYKLKENYVNLSYELDRYVYLIQANVAKEDFEDQLSAEIIEEVSKQAATEIMSLIN